MNLAAFPHKRLLMQHQTVVSDGDDHAVFLYALNASKAIGIRNDCLGDSWFTDEMSYLYGKYPVVADRWKSAPLMTELCGGGFATAATQIAKFHVANIGNGNYGSLAAYSATSRTAFEQDNILSGYRFALTRVTMPASVPRGAEFTVSSSWTNRGVTPAYEHWIVKFQLQSPTTGAAVWTGSSKLDLRTLTPTGLSSHGVTDTFAVPTSVRAGTYAVSVVITSTTGYLRPLRLAILHRQGDGSYPLGITVRVR
jgi:hypothetical protein